ncbi:MAG: DUF1643 domain-containing protein [Gracilimonas sp.]|uniref:DUF1643 domain-containing protein n=1 Tax=Gracilimonas sp. TaxID=1974203 RepID=UPI00199D183F|nr:DUF1643 domain-containing protein [Gracilimonas sp.]MBD3617526.1 DUF1643 domain-containing protein [Gracilimonas sp.]
MFKDKPWIYDHDEPLTRYSLGQEGENPLICFGVNPSTAKPNDLDPTVASVARFARDHGYDGWLMFNLYPQRATNPDKMHRRFQNEIHQKNVDVIANLTEGLSADVWCAWGTLIEKRSYLSRCLQDIFDVLAQNNCTYFKRGRISKAGHPHHPLYLKKTAPPETFDLDKYVKVVVNGRDG